MADHTISISDTLTIFGPGPTNKWGTMVWGSDAWGAQTDVITETGKYLSNSITPSDATYKSVGKYVDDSLALTSNPSSETLKDGSGYNYVFVSNTTEGEERDPTTWTEV